MQITAFIHRPDCIGVAYRYIPGFYALARQRNGGQAGHYAPLRPAPWITATPANPGYDPPLEV